MFASRSHVGQLMFSVACREEITLKGFVLISDDFSFKSVLPIIAPDIDQLLKFISRANRITQ